MTSWLDPAIERSSGTVGEFLRELKAMLEHVRPAALDVAACEARPCPDGTELLLPHVRERHWSIWVTAHSKSIVVGVAEMHEHFAPWREELDEEDERPYWKLAVDMIAELMRGEIEIHTTYRGNAVASVRPYLIGPDGAREGLGSTGLPGGLMLWRPKRTEVEVVDFEARG